METSKILYSTRLDRSATLIGDIRILKCSHDFPSSHRWAFRPKITGRRGKTVITYLRRVRMEIIFTREGIMPKMIRGQLKSLRVITLVGINLVHHFSKYLSRTKIKNQMMQITKHNKSKSMPTAVEMKMRKIKIQLIAVQNTLKAFQSLLMRLSRKKFQTIIILF